MFYSSYIKKSSVYTKHLPLISIKITALFCYSLLA